MIQMVTLWNGLCRVLEVANRSLAVAWFASLAAAARRNVLGIFGVVSFEAVWVVNGNAFSRLLRRIQDSQSDPPGRLNEVVVFLCAALSGASVDPVELRDVLLVRIFKVSPCLPWR